MTITFRNYTAKVCCVSYILCVEVFVIYYLLSLKMYRGFVGSNSKSVVCYFVHELKIRLD